MAILVIIMVLLLLCFYLFMFSEFSNWPFKIPYKIKTKDKVVAITFDDGPNPPHTDSILKYLSDSKVRATFFVVGSCAEKYPNLVKRMLKDGHQIANHSHSHKFSNYLLSLSFSSEIDASQRIINNIISKKPRYIRLPWLFRTPFIIKSIKSRNLSLVGGRFCHPLEVLQVDSSKIANRAFKVIKPGSIIIFHDGFDAKGGDRSQTVDAVKLLVPMLKEAGFRFVTVSEMFGEKPYF
jgi:peptidoglycan/xylan/chitin deacetylase (PgdA/CDA1 family)